MLVIALFRTSGFTVNLISKFVWVCMCLCMRVCMYVYACQFACVCTCLCVTFVVPYIYVLILRSSVRFRQKLKKLRTQIYMELRYIDPQARVLNCFYK